MRQNQNSKEKWIVKFKNIIIAYTKNRAPDPFMIWFRHKNSEGFFKNDFERVLAVLIDARFDQRTTAENALKNTLTVVKRGALKRLVTREELPLLIPRQGMTAEKWTDLFCSSMPRLHELARQIVVKGEWDAIELLEFMLHDFKVPYLGVKTSRLSVRWLHELVPNLRINMTTYKIPVDSLVYRVTCRLGIINPNLDRYFGDGSPADQKIQSFVKQVFPDKPYLLDEPLWSTGRRAISGGHCFPQNPERKYPQRYYEWVYTVWNLQPVKGEINNYKQNQLPKKFFSKYHQYLKDYDFLPTTDLNDKKWLVKYAKEFIQARKKKMVGFIKKYYGISLES